MFPVVVVPDLRDLPLLMNLLVNLVLPVAVPVEDSKMNLLAHLRDIPTRMMMEASPLVMLVPMAHSERRLVELTALPVANMATLILMV